MMFVISTQSADYSIFCNANVRRGDRFCVLS